MSLRHKIIHIEQIDNKHYYVLFGKISRFMTRFSIYLRFRDFDHRLQMGDRKLERLRRDFRKYVLYNGINYINKERISSEIENLSFFGINKKMRLQKIIVSLTSYPDRMYDIHYCLYSLLNQSFKPDKIILWLAPEQFPNGESDIPQKVLALKEHGLSIGWYHNIKSYKKLIPALLEYPDDIIVTADDDMYYSENWLESLFFAYDGGFDPICHRAHRIMPEAVKIAPYNKWIMGIQDEEGSVLNFPTGCGGVLYPPHSLHKDVTNEELINSLAPNADDIWFWAMALINNRKIKVVTKIFDENETKSKDMCYVNPCREVGIDGQRTLYQQNIYENDNQLAAVIKAYPAIQSIISKSRLPLVSVIIPVYNTEKYLRKCLDSALNQTLHEIEVICINDGSTDGSLTILKEYELSDSRVQIIDKPNGGYGHTMNVGIAHATGEYIAFLESDDYITSNAYEILYKNARINDVDIIKAGFYEVFSDSIEKNKIQIARQLNLCGKVLNPAIEKKLFYTQLMNCLGLFKRSFIEKNGIVHNESPGAAHQDLGFWFQTMMYAKRVYLLDDYFYCYRQDNSGSSMNNMVSYDYAINEYNFIRRIMETNPYLIETFSDVYWHRLYNSCHWALTKLREDIKKEFIYVLSEKYREAIELGEFDDNCFYDNQRERLQELVSNPEQYYINFYASPKEVISYNKPMISIIMPVFNKEKHLAKCLDSIVGQSIKNTEIICINDGSKDNSLSILKKYAKKDKRITIITQANAGAGIARNNGIKNAKGEFIAFMDADDYYPDSDVLEFLYTAAIKHNVSICGGDFSVDDMGEITARKQHKDFNTTISGDVIQYEDFQRDYGFYLYIYKRSLIKDNEILFPSYLRYQDPPFFVAAMYAAKEFCGISKIVYTYRWSKNQVSWTNDKVIDLIHGITDNIVFSRDHLLNKLLHLSIERLCFEYRETIVNSIKSGNNSAKELIKNIYAIVSEDKNLSVDEINGIRNLIDNY